MAWEKIPNVSSPHQLINEPSVTLASFQLTSEGLKRHQREAMAVIISLYYNLGHYTTYQ